MCQPQVIDNRRTRTAVRRLLDAVDRAVAAAPDVEAARAALDRVSNSTNQLRVVQHESEGTDAT